MNNKTISKDLSVTAPGILIFPGEDKLNHEHQYSIKFHKNMGLLVFKSSRNHTLTINNDGNAQINVTQAELDKLKSFSGAEYLLYDLTDRKEIANGLITTGQVQVHEQVHEQAVQYTIINNESGTEG